MKPLMCATSQCRAAVPLYAKCQGLARAVSQFSSIVRHMKQNSATGMTSRFLFIVALTAPALHAQVGGETLRDRPDITRFELPGVAKRIGYRENRPYVRVRINGKGPFTFAIDLTAQHSTLDNDVFIAAGLSDSRKVSEQSAAPGSATTGSFVRVPSLSLGKVVFEGVDMRVEELDQRQDRQRTFDGVLSLSLFWDCLLTIDYPRSRLILTQHVLPPSDGKEILPIKSRDGSATINLSIMGTNVDFAISTKSPHGFTVPPMVWEKLPLRTRLQGIDDVDGLISDFDLTERVVKGNVPMGRYTLRRPPVQKRNGPATLGYDILRNFSVIIDQRNQRVRFMRAREGEIFFPVRTVYGLVFERRGSDYYVAHVLPGTQGSQYNVPIGSRLLFVERQPIRSFDDDKLRATLPGCDGIFVVFTHEEGIEAEYRLSP